ncbi:hypothetical protein [Bacillus mycoides]|uniref:hypothetical protein n=1 Tax=Bacillus mycoides TaxID=1405 RepID=UPI0011A1F472|nr:hypothetical protein [Bacillus mycoides]
MRKKYIDHEMNDFLRLKIRKWKDGPFRGTELHQIYIKWCIENNTVPKRKIELYKALEDRGFEKTKDKIGIIYFKGVKLK